ncbi:hypothetical protein NUSPORA_01229 [Nucleospora cyclopteri]
MYFLIFNLCPFINSLYNGIPLQIMESIRYEYFLQNPTNDCSCFPIACKKYTFFKFINAFPNFISNFCNLKLDTNFKGNTTLPLNQFKIKTVVLNLDFTLLHSTIIPKGIELNFYFLTRIYQNSFIILNSYFVTPRPFLLHFLQSLRALGLRIIIYTSATEVYAAEIIKKLDIFCCIEKVHCRNCCVKTADLSNVMKKNLKLIGVDIFSTLIVDFDKQFVEKSQNDRVYQIKPFTRNNMVDQELLYVLEYIIKCNSS